MCSTAILHASKIVSKQSEGEDAAITGNGASP